MITNPYLITLLILGVVLFIAAAFVFALLED